MQFPGTGFDEATLVETSQRVFDDAEEAALLLHVVRRATKHMSGRKRNGLPDYLRPSDIKLGVNRYEPGEAFPTHRDGVVSNDIVPITLIGEGDFMEVRGGKRGTMPGPAQIRQSWHVTPGSGVAIRNHGTARSTDGYGYPQHAFQNGADQPRVALLVEMFYGKQA